MYSSDRAKALQAATEGAFTDKLGICSHILADTPLHRPTLIMPANTEYTVYQSFVYTQGKVPLDTIVIHEDGSIDI